MSVILRQIALIANQLLAQTYFPQYELAPATPGPITVNSVITQLSSSRTATTRFTDSQSTNTTRFIDSETASKTTGITVGLASITVPDRTTSQDNLQWTPLPSDLPECNFPLLHWSASLLKPPLNMANSVNLDEWESVSRQLSELRRLLNTHRNALIRRHGSREFYNLHVHLEDMVNKPLKYSCAILQQLLVEEFNLKQSRARGWGERVTDLLDLISGAENNLTEYIRETKSLSSAPSWARGTAVLRSAGCPNQDCFKIGETTIDLFATHMPYQLLKGVVEAKEHVATGLIPTLNLTLERTVGTLLWWYSQFKLLFTREILTSAYIFSFLIFLSRFVIVRYFHFETQAWGAADRATLIQ
ncbi:hypothetical protein GGR58DRAFT_503834 [Xylaria digitata]|nr:hypothetical protein GGR58DRAFT_503834 [Xylaria digitata]